MSKPLVFCGDSRSKLRSFPKEARFDLGSELQRIQVGEEPFDWKPMSSIGSGVCEIRARTRSGAYRVVYFARFEDAVYVLHCFQKKTQKTSQRDLEIARQRLVEVVKEHRS